VAQSFGEAVNRMQGLPGGVGFNDPFSPPSKNLRLHTPLGNVPADHILTGCRLRECNKWDHDGITSGCGARPAQQPVLKG
jgi:hypothetical protein